MVIYLWFIIELARYSLSTIENEISTNISIKKNNVNFPSGQAKLNSSL